MLSADRPSQRIRRVVLAGYWTLMYFLTHWPGVDRFRIRPDWPFPDFDRFVHFTLYAGWAVLWWWVLAAGRRRVTRAAMVWLAAGAAVYAMFDEMTQAIVGRHPDPIDFAFDMLGVLSVLTVLSYWQRRQRFARMGMPHSRTGGLAVLPGGRVAKRAKGSG
jgi:VanZ family protein